LDQIHRELERINPSAARSLEEGMEETLTVHKLQMPEMLRPGVWMCCRVCGRMGRFMDPFPRIPRRR
jgi:hypothetical protein